VIHLEVPEHRGEIHVKAGHLHDASHWAVKVASGFSETDPPAIDGLVLLFDATDGSPAAFVLDEGLITDLRTGAAGGVAARYLAPSEVRRAAIVGTGLQAAQQLEALACVRPGIEHVAIWGRRAERAGARADELGRCDWLPEGCVVEPAGSVQEAVEGAEVVVTCTASREPLLQSAWLAPGAHVTAVGSDGPNKRELDAEVLAGADVVVVDSRPQASAIGELHHAIDAGALRAEDTAELGEIAAGTRAGRVSDEQRTVGDLTGVGIQDVAAAELVLERARTHDLGRRLEL
jgi:ornithine cyclodeaminase